MAAKLAGLRVVVTRPSGQASALSARIRAVGAEVLALPLLEIAPPVAPVRAEVLRAQLVRAERVIFISPNAVRMALQCLPAHAWPSAPQLVAIGQGTARALQAAGFAQILAPVAGADSEALLALPEFQQLAGQHILLVRGEGGRELLAQTLAERGAQVDHAVVYRRVAMPPSLAELREHGHLLFVLTSSAALRVLLDAAQHADDLAWLGAQDFVFAHPRIAEQAKTSGLNRGMIAPSPEDDAVFAALLHYAEQQHLHMPES
ncbi:MAG: uroporphyrinogen-III synthase [Halothiobacillaceae bacterium]|nr:uroporphyrinogen-III synthase [Halothiobacillaceae bacterium]